MKVLFNTVLAAALIVAATTAHAQYHMPGIGTYDDYGYYGSKQTMQRQLQEQQEQIARQQDEMESMQRDMQHELEMQQHDTYMLRYDMEVQQRRAEEQRLLRETLR